jgi:hypothetical protein
VQDRTALQGLFVMETKDIIGYEGRYEITSDGKVFSLNGRRKGKHEMKGCNDTCGYISFRLRNGKGCRKDVRLHALLAIHFLTIPERLKGLKIQVNHIDGNKMNNNLSNLEWCTPKENIHHAIRTGLLKNKGLDSYACVLSNEDVFKIIELRRIGYSHQKIADTIGKVGRRHITDVLNRTYRSNDSLFDEAFTSLNSHY